MADNDESDDIFSPPSITIQTQVSLTTILANGLMFFTALTIRDYMVSNVNVLPKQILPAYHGIREFIKLIITLLIVAGSLVAINRWKNKIESEEKRRILLNK